MAERLNVAMIGCGGISNSHMPNILNTPEMHLVATMDHTDRKETHKNRVQGFRDSVPKKSVDIAQI